MKLAGLLLMLSLTTVSAQALAVTCGIGMDDSTCGTPLRFSGCRVFDASGKFAYYQPDPALCAAGGNQAQNTTPNLESATDGNTDGVGGGTAGGAPSADGPGGVGGSSGVGGAGSGGGDNGGDSD